MSRPYTSAIDWLKFLGITLILYGHLAAWAPFADLPPIYSKQLGVAFFLFASGYSLSAETREPWRVAFNRLFDIYLFGIPFALLVTAVSFSVGWGLQLSNYLPFMAGANVVFNNFPANPTTWYLGTYVQLIVLWTLVGRRLRPSAAVLVASFLAEIAIRAVLMATAGRFIAYMLLPNWSTVFLLGCWHERHDHRALVAPGDPRSSATWALVAIPVLVVGWLFVAALVPFEPTFPFMRLQSDSVVGVLLVSTMVSTIYVGLTQLVYLAVVARPAPQAVRFVARNTLLIFLVHMPVYYALGPLMEHWHLTPVARSVAYMVICLPGLAWCSEAVRRAVRPRDVRERLAVRLFRWGQSAGAGADPFRGVASTKNLTLQ